MSQIGQNIRKIRSAKKLNQTQFAEIFNLTRGSVGAYEEGRAEPKIDTIIQIANYFSLSIDLLLNKEITVNDLFHLDAFRQKLNEAHSFDQVKQKSPAPGIGLVTIKNQLEYIVNYGNKDFLSNLPKIGLPVNFKGTTRAFELNGSEMEYNQNGLHHGDILLSELMDNSKRSKVGHIYIIVHKRGIDVRRLRSEQSNNYTLASDDPNYTDTIIEKNELYELWIVKGVYSTYLNTPKLIENKVLQLESRIEALEKRIKEK